MVVRGVGLVAAARSIAVNCFICADVSFRSRFISSIITVVALVVMAMVAVLGILLRLVCLLLLLPTTDLRSRLSCSRAFANAVMALYYSVEGPGSVGGGEFLGGD